MSLFIGVMNLWWGEIEIWGESTGGIFSGGGGMSKFLASGGGALPIPCSRESLVIPLKSGKDFKPPLG